MGVHIGDNKLEITTGQKKFHFDFPKGVDWNLEHEIDFIIKHNEFLVEYTTKN